MKFTLERGKWYACELIGDEFDQDKCSYSPIKVLEITPLKTGKGWFVLRFRHLNYPEGVQGKEYKLQTIERGQSFLLAKATEYDPPRFLQIYEINVDWLRRHFPGQGRGVKNVQAYLDKQ
jgi:hypothetical protein